MNYLLFLLLASIFSANCTYFPECKGYKEMSSCLNDCNCVWCYDEFSTTNITACVSGGHAADLCPYWDGKIVVAADTDHCKGIAATRTRVFFLIFIVPFGLFTLTMLLFVLVNYIKRRRQLASNYIPIA